MKKLLRTVALLLTVTYLFGCLGVTGVSAESDSAVGSDISDISDIADNYENEYVTPVRNAPMYYLPDNMRAIIISPEVDFLTSPDDNENDVLNQLGDIFDTITDIGLNAVIIKTSVEDRVYCDLDMNRNGKIDFIKLAVDAARSYYLGVYLVFDIGKTLNSEDDSSFAVDELVSEIHRFTIKYPCDGIILDDYYNDPEINNFTKYMRQGSGIGYENWLYDSTEYLFETASGVVRLTDNTIPVGVMINDVWANNTSTPEGSPTADITEAYYDGFADTKKYIEQGLVDFITLRCYGSITDTGLPFTETAQWWGEICAKNSTPMYLIHYNEKLGNGWAEDQLLRQLKTAKESINSYKGSVFNSYRSLESNVLNSAVKLKEYYANLIDEESLFAELEMFSPKNASFTTYEPYVNFAGTFDQNFDVKFNGNPIALNEAGNFYFEEKLKIGMNTYTIEHKGKVQTYRIQHNIIVMREIDKSISEDKIIKVDGGTAITLEAIAYKGATVTATINGQTIKLSEQAGVLDGTDANSSYTSFTGRYKTPAGIIGVEQALGQISIQASYSGQSKTMNGAKVFVNAEPEPPPKIDLNAVMYDESSFGTGEVVGTINAVRSADQSVTFVRLNQNHTNIFDAKTTGTVFDPQFGQLPAGTVDYYKSTVGNFHTTESGKRFLADESTLVSGSGIGENALYVWANGSHNGSSFLEISLDTRISYNIEAVGLSYFTEWSSNYNIKDFDAEYIYITFDNVTSVTKLPSFENNYVFSSGKWEQVTIDNIIKFRLVLQLRSRGLYAGVSSYYNAKGNLLLTFPVVTGSLSGKTIVIDPGHGINAAGKIDPGAIGHIREWDANLAIAKKLEAKLKALGANVVRLKTEESYHMTKTRALDARIYGCDMFISLHSNSVTGNSSARGTEVFYYTPFSQPLANAISKSIAGYFTNNVYSDKADKNRGAKNSYFWVTTEQGFPSVLVEMGFVTNLEDAMALANDTHQNGIADAIVKGIQNYLSRSSISYVPDGSTEIPDSHIPEQPEGPVPPVSSLPPEPEVPVPSEETEEPVFPESPAENDSGNPNENQSDSNGLYENDYIVF